MAKITLTKPKLSSDELERMLCSDTTDAQNESVSATNISGEMNRSATTNERSATTDGVCSVTTNERSDTTTDVSATNNLDDSYCSDTTSEEPEICSATTSEECSATTKTESQRVNQWKKENRDTLRIDLPKGMKAEIQAEAKKRGCSVTTLIQRALASYCSDTTE